MTALWLTNGYSFANLMAAFLLGAAIAAFLIRSSYYYRKQQQRDGMNVVASENAPRGIVSHGFLKDVLARLWPHFKIAVARALRDLMHEGFAKLPRPLSTCKVTKIDLGNVPIRLDNIVVHELQQDSLQFDMDVVWDSDCDVRLKADYVGSFGVRKVVLRGRMSVILKPVTDYFPCFAAISYSFINPPELQLKFTGLAQVADFKIFATTVRNIIQDAMASIMVLPERMLYKIDEENDFFRSYQPPLGILRLTLVSGRGFIVEQRRLRKADVPDVYCIITACGGKVWRTKTIKNNLTPQWNESADFVLSDYDQVLEVDAFDEDGGPLDPDDDLGLAKLTAGELADKTMEVELIRTGGKKQVRTGAFVKLKCEVCGLTSNMDSLENPSGQNENHICGMLFILVARAYGLPLKTKNVASYVRVTFGGGSDKPEDDFSFVTSKVVSDLNPHYDAAFQIPLTSKTMPAKGTGSVVLELMNGEIALGTTEVTFDSLKQAPGAALAERLRIGPKGAELEVCVSLHGIQLPDSHVKRSVSTKSLGPSMASRSLRVDENVSNPLAASITHGALGRVQITIVKGRGFGVQKKRGLFRKADVPDPYCKVRFGASPNVWRTSTIRDCVSPFWNESNVYPLTAHGQAISVDVFDEDKNRTDTFLGHCRLTVGSVLSAGGTLEMELKNKGRGTSSFLVVRCEHLNR